MYFKNLLLIGVLTIPLFVNAQYQNFADSYSTLSTIAGKGDVDDKGYNGWLENYENGNATEVELSRPHMAMADSVGNVYIADKDAHAIRKVATDGKIVTVAGTNVAGDNGDGVGTDCMLNSPNGLWVKADGTVYILDLGNNKIRRLNTDGSLETIVDDTVGYSLGRGLWVTANEDSIFYASGTSVKLWTAAGGIETYASGFSQLGNIVQDKNSFLVVTDRGANRVYRVSKDGQTKETIAGSGLTVGGGDGLLAAETALYGVRGVWFLDDNSYFVACHEGSQVWYIDVLGYIHLFLDGAEGDSYHSGDGEDYQTVGAKISEARSITVDYNGNVIVTENDRGFIRKIQNDYTYYYTDIYSGSKTSEQVIAYPNPAQSSVNIDFYACSNDNVSVILVNCIGKVVKVIEHKATQKGVNTVGLTVSDLPNGVYFYSLRNGENNATGKLIIRK